MSDRWQELSVFVRAAESGSFSQAARELRLSQPSVSRIIGELEARLGVKLLLRTTRRITMTDAGALFLERAREILAQSVQRHIPLGHLTRLRCAGIAPCYSAVLLAFCSKFRYDIGGLQTREPPRLAQIPVV